MPRRTLITLTAALAISLAATATAGAQAPDQQEVGLLFTHTAKRGTLEPVEGKPRFTLRLHAVAPQVVWFSDRPARKSGQIPIRGFVREWAGFGFDADRPNAALTLLDAANDQDTVVLRLGEPRYRAKRNTVRYSARVLDEASGNLSHLEPQRDGRVPRRFGAASLFIDDASAPVFNGCVIQPSTQCAGADLVGADLTGANLTGADLTAANLAYASLFEAELRGADLGLAFLADAILTDADLTYASLFDAVLVRANLTGADLTGASLLNANLIDATLTDADLTDADLTNADLNGAIFCRTTMPDGSINNGDC